MLGIVLPDSYSQSLANNYKWHSKVLNFYHENFQHPSNEGYSDDTSNANKNETESHVVSDSTRTQNGFCLDKFKPKINSYYNSWIICRLNKQFKFPSFFQN